MPIVLVPGFLDRAVVYRRLRRRLEAAGHDVYSYAPRSSTGLVRIEQLAADLATFVDERIASRSPVALVGFSMGGIIARYYVQRLGGAARVHRLVTVSAPNRGTYMAWFLPFPGIRQLRPGSALLRDLNRDVDALNQVRFASLWSPMDLMIVPPSSSCLGVGVERMFVVPIHAWMPRSGRVIDDVLRLIEA